MSISLRFDTCIVCGENVATHYDSDTFSWCSTHSDHDADKALKEIENKVERSRKELQR